MRPFSTLARIFGKTYSLSALNKTEFRTYALFSPFDWVVVGFFFALMALGASILFASASHALSEEIPVRGGTHIEGVVGSPRFINPLLAISETDNDVTRLVFGGLMKPEADGTLTPYLAEAFEISDDGLVYTFTLRDDIEFHDGTPITAKDVVFTVRSAKNPDIKSPKRANWEGVEVAAIDERTVSFTLREPYGLFLENTTLGILPSRLWESVTPEEFPFSDLNGNPVGSGMYRVQSIKKSSSGVPSEYRLVASKASPIRPYIANFVFRFYPNRDALSGALQNDDVDAAHSVVSDAGALRGTTLNEAVFARVFGVFFNQNQQALFTDEIVRRALDRALDKNLIVDTIVGGYGTVLTGPLPPDNVAESDTSHDAERRTEEARILLTENGWTLGDDGVFEKTVKKETTRLSFTLTTGNAPELKAAAEAVAEQWRVFGADVRLQFFEQNDLNLEVIRPRKYDALLFGLVVGRDLDLFAFWHSSQRNDPGLNIALYANIATDKYLETARKELDPEKRRAQAERAATEIQGETAAIFLYAPHFTYVHEPQLHGVSIKTVSVPSDRFAGMEDWYLYTERVWPFFIK